MTGACGNSKECAPSSAKPEKKVETKPTAAAPAAKAPEAKPAAKPVETKPAAAPAAAKATDAKAAPAAKPADKKA